MKNVLGMRFGKLVVVEKLQERKGSGVVWLCRCDCGKTTKVTTAALFHGTKSCGCLIHDVLIARNTTHGMTGTREYNNTRSQKRRERKKKLDVKWNHEMKMALKKMFPQCVYCGSTKDIEVDHVIPLSEGRGLEPGNATILCQHHNGVKKAKSLDKLPEDMQKAILESAAKFKEYWYSLHPEESPVPF